MGEGSIHLQTDVTINNSLQSRDELIHRWASYTLRVCLARCGLINAHLHVIGQGVLLL